MPLIEIRGLTKLYQMGESVVHALDGVDLTIERGEFVAITGASGSGKSTMMHLLGCLDRPTAGDYFLDGRNVAEMGDRDLADIRNSQIGFVFQTFNLINRTSAVENVAVPLFYARKTNTNAPARRALERVGLSGRASHQPSELSGGERQRVAIARAIVNDPLLLMADEPTGNLDSRTGEQIMQIFHDLNAQGVTIVIVTHEPDIAEQARRIVQMRDGKIVSDRATARGGGPGRGETVDDPPESEPAPIYADDSGGGVAVSSPVDVAVAERAVAPAKAEVDVSTLPRRMVRGATSGVTCSIIAVVLFAVGVGTQLSLKYFYGDELAELQSLNPGERPSKMPSTGIMVGGLVSSLSFLIGLVMAVLGVVFSAGARKRMRREVGNWVGGRRALTGLLMGWGIILVAAGSVAYGIIKAVNRMPG